jgi:hypothetical protein
MTEARIGPQIDGLAFLEYLGTGGYSDVFLYERRSPRMRVAVKVLKDARLSDAELAQFAAEAETMAELADHPYIVQVFSTGTLVDGRPFLVMKYYPPPNLGARAAEERFALADVLRTGVKIASAVETAHRAGILHRDIKPANVLVSQYGEPGLTDFGIAGHAADAEDDDDLGVSIPWSPPEVLTGGSNGSVQSDVYSLGATVWHLLAGRSPFETPGGDNAPRALMGRILRSAPPATGRADIPQSLERLLAQAMAKNPAVRPRSALDFARALQAVEQEQRFARTDIIVEGLGSARRTGERPVAPPRGDQTRMRAPVRVTAQPSAPVQSLAPRRPSGVVGAAPLAEPPTTARPVVPAPASGRRERVPGPSASPGATVQRPVTTVTPVDAPGTAPRRGGLRRPYVGVIAAAVVVMAIVIGIVLSAGGSSPQHRKGGTSPTVLDTEDLNPPDTLAGAPTVRARYDAARNLVRFTWSAANGSSGGSFGWYPAGNPASLTRTSRTSVDVPRTGTAKVCIQVQQIRTDGSASSPSKVVCG